MKKEIVLTLSLCLSCASAFAEPSAAGALNSCAIRPVHFQGWRAQEMVNPWLKLTFVPQLGGRLMQVEFNGHPYLFVNPKYSGKYISPIEAGGEWINYGGDKIWPMPEGNSDDRHWILQSTAIDDLPYALRVISQGDQCALELTGQPDSITGLQYVRTVSITADSPRINFHSVMKNATAHPIEWSVQSVSQYDLSDHEHPGDYNHNLWAYTPVRTDSIYPDGYHVRTGLADDPSFAVTDGLFRLHWMYFMNEVWLDSSSGWLAVVDQQSQYGMIERFNFVPNGDYPGKATVIFYKNGPSVSFDREGRGRIAETTTDSTPYYMEAEINSPIVKLLPQQTYAMDTTWSPVRIGGAPQVMNDAGVVERGLSALRHGSKLTLNGIFAVFTPGTLTALLLDERGVEIARLELQLVRPQENLSLQKEIPASAKVTQVVLKVLDSHGTDYGVLDRARVESSEGVSKL